MADGVGGIYSTYKVSSASFAKALATRTNAELSSGSDIPRAVAGAFSVLETKRRIGAATLGTVALRDGLLQYACVGDALVRVFHPISDRADSLRCIARAGSSGRLSSSPPQQLKVVPGAQLGSIVSDGTALRSLVVGRTSVVEGDLVLLGTDGLIDNLDDDAILGVLQMKGCAAARALADGATRAALKKDDVTVMVGLVCAS